MVAPKKTTTVSFSSVPSNISELAKLMQTVWLSLEPRQGIRADAYPQDAQDLLNSALPGTQVYLGASCFHATIHINANGRHVQTTPAYANKVAGRRSVVSLPNTTTSVTAFWIPNYGWTLHAAPYAATKELPCPPIPQCVKWEWSTNTSLADSREVDWISYEDECQQKLETAWLSGTMNTVVELQIGIRKYRVKIDQSKSVMMQLNEDGSKRRFVRRINRTNEHVTSVHMHVEREKVMLGDTSCAICLSDFSEAPLLPRHTTECGHTFHAACIDPIMRGDKRCPMCRAAL